MRKMATPPSNRVVPAQKTSLRARLSRKAALLAIRINSNGPPQQMA
jgi:hypothetical protein